MSIRNSLKNKAEVIAKTGVVLMTYGSATTAEHVKEYFENIYGGKASPALIADFENRYRLVGGSPLIRITGEQAALLQKKLGENFVVKSGMRHSAPRIVDAVAECRTAGVNRIVGIVLSPQFSSIIMEGYRTAFLSAAKTAGFEEDAAIVTGPWPAELHFIELLAGRVKKSLAELSKKYEIAAGAGIPVIFTTHSLPESVVKKDPAYLDQLKSTIAAVLARLKTNGMPLDPENWFAGYQSAGHTPEAWLKPDLTDILAELSKKKKFLSVPAVLIVPIQFLADHLEILYDLDIAAKEQCAERGIEYNRIELPNTDPLFIEALAAIAKAA